MPNHTSNCVDVSVQTGCSKEQLALAELKTMLAINSEEFDFNGMIPMPKELKKGIGYGFDNCPRDYKNKVVAMFLKVEMFEISGSQTLALTIGMIGAMPIGGQSGTLTMLMLMLTLMMS